MSVLITGGAGYLGSMIAHACVDAGLEPVILDDLSAGSRESVPGLPFHHGDYADADLIGQVVADHGITHAVHCAARTSVPESVRDPLGYHQNNVAGIPAFLAALSAHGCRRVILSSSASVYAPGESVVTEESPTGPPNPYAAGKLMAEQILADAAAAGLVDGIALRYFNPIGADPLLRTGRRPAVEPSVVGALTSAVLRGVPFQLAGQGWPTRDGSAVRDYLHVADLAEAHVLALRRFDEVVGAGSRSPGFDVLNLGSGSGTTVRELVAAFVRIWGAPVEVLIGESRPGDSAGAVASAARAADRLGWHPTRTVEQALGDALAWAAVVEAQA